MTRHLNKGVPSVALKSYLSVIRKWVSSEPVIHIDDSDIVKPDGYKFEALGIVRDGSKSTDIKNIYEKGYHVTEACVLTENNHPVSIFSEIHSSKEKNFTSINDITFSAMERGAAMFGRAAFVMDRGYDNNKMFLKLDELQHNSAVSTRERSKHHLCIKEKVHFCYYRLAKGIRGILIFAKEGIRLWFRTKRPKYRQLCLKLVA